MGRDDIKKWRRPASCPMIRTSAAYDAVHTLWVHTHYLSCDGAGRSSSEKDDETSEGGPGQVDEGENKSKDGPLEGG
jgi:hypothetical protein